MELLWRQLLHPHRRSVYCTSGQAWQLPFHHLPLFLVLKYLLLADDIHCVWVIAYPNWVAAALVC
jgi:hypothetical protein